MADAAAPPSTRPRTGARPLAADLTGSPPTVTMTVLPGAPLSGVLSPVQLDALAAAITQLWAVPHDGLPAACSWRSPLAFARRLTDGRRPAGRLAAARTMPPSPGGTARSRCPASVLSTQHHKPAYGRPRLNWRPLRPEQRPGRPPPGCSCQAPGRGIGRSWSALVHVACPVHDPVPGFSQSRATERRHSVSG
jgi:hypothetical protein